MFADTKDKNLFTRFLSLLQVKHTKSFANKLYNEHPYKNSLFALADLLKLYGVETRALRLKHKDDLSALEAPFIAYYYTFVLVTKVSREDVALVWESGKEEHVPVEKFREHWTGVVLLAEADENSKEPDYELNRRKEVFRNLETFLLLFFLALLGGGIYVGRELYQDPGMSLLLLANLAGLYIGYLFVLKHLNIHSVSADLLCSAFSYHDCNDILKSKAARLWGVIGWSEVGFGYFASNLAVLLFAPQWLSYLAAINVCALPYTFWSVWYQKTTSQWCGLCLAVQVLLWLVFIIDLSCGYVRLPAFRADEVLMVASVYALPFLAVSLLLPPLIEATKVEKLAQSMRGLKMKDEVFQSLLSHSKHYQAARDTSQILFGNRDAALTVTVFSNPLCGPCAALHKKVDHLLDVAGDKVCVQYIFTSFGEKYEDCTRFLIAAYLNNSEEEARKIFNEWYAYRKFDREECFRVYPYRLEDGRVTEERERHREWRNRSALRFTPTILLNGYKLPSIYSFEEIEYLIDL